MKKQLTLALVLATTLTFTACEEKKKQDGTTPTPTETEAAAETQQPSQEAAAPPPTQETAEVVKGSFTDPRDDKTYKTVKINTQTWMAENLNYEAEYSNCYDKKPANCKKYGRLYDWEAAQTACPSGWKLPSSKEWETLVNLAGGEKVAFKKLKAKSNNGTDDFNFAALLGGEGGFNFSGIGNIGKWWSSTPTYSDSDEERGAYAIAIGDEYMLIPSTVRYSFSVRCIQDGAKPAKAEAATFTDPRDNKTYKTAKIGTQTWLAENLNHETKNSKCYENNQANCGKYGRLYDWQTATKACPSGWHLPSREEWGKLFHYADGTSGTKYPYQSETSSKNLRAKSGWEDNENGTDKFGFAALPSGTGSDKGKFNAVGSYAAWWSSTEWDNDDAHYRSTDYSFDADDVSGKGEYLSVRCIKD